MSVTSALWTRDVRTLAVASLFAGVTLLLQNPLLLAQESDWRGRKNEPATILSGGTTIPRTLPDFIDLAEHLSAALHKTGKGRDVLLLIRRGANTFFLTLRAAG